ncbi:MAG: tyrosine-type recombinase/integrase [Thermoguttaceae bacterium]
MPKTNPKATSAKEKAQKPRPDFPLFPHRNGWWAKKIRGKFHYFGKVDDDPQGEHALDRWNSEKDDLLAGRTPQALAASGSTVRDLANHFLTYKKGLVDSGELLDATFSEYHATCERVLKVFGADTQIDTLTQDDFQRLRANVAKQWGPVRLANEIQRVRSLFRYGQEAGLSDKIPRYGPGFKKPSAKTLRKVRAKRGLRMFERDELRSVLAVAPPTMKAMILLAINAGLGNNDCATLPVRALNLERGWLVYPRPKTGIERKTPLWPETISALKVVLAERPEPTNENHRELVFISPRGESYISKGSGYRIAKTILPLLKKAKVNRPGLSFYALRHTFQTIAEGARDLAAVQSIMGYAPGSADMSAVYRERIDDERLSAVTSHVRKWLFGEALSAGPSEPGAEQRSIESTASN